MKRTPLARKTPLRARTPMRKRSRKPRRVEAVRDGAWLDNVRELPNCVRCGAYGVEAAHRDFGKGFGMKTDDVATAALCKACHHELGNGNALGRATRRSEMDTAIVETLIKLGRAGKVLAA